MHLLTLILLPAAASSLASGPSRTAALSRISSPTDVEPGRRAFFIKCPAATAAAALAFSPSLASAAKMDEESFLRMGGVAMPMGVGSQANGKGKPETGVFLRDGGNVSRDGAGAVAAEVLVDDRQEAVLVSFVSPWKVATGGLFDVECRDNKTGDGCYLVVAPLPKGVRSVSALPEGFFTEELFKPTGRYSFYGQPTDVKVRKGAGGTSDDGYRTVEIGFSNLSQSTNAEIPRKCVVSATVPTNTNSVVMLVGSASTSRWKKGAEEDVRKTVGSFRAAAAPKSGLRSRGGNA